MDSALLDPILDKHRGKPGDLIHVLMAIQHQNHWLPREVLLQVAEALGIPFGRVLRIATLYKTFSLSPKGRHEVQVCNGISCHLRGAKRVMAAVEQATGVKAGETDANWQFSVEDGTCLGTCSIGPEVIVDGHHHTRMTPAKVEGVIEQYRQDATT